MGVEHSRENILPELLAERDNGHRSGDDDDAVGVDDFAAEPISEVSEERRNQYFDGDVAADHPRVFHVVELVAALYRELLEQQHRLQQVNTHKDE